MKWIRCGGSGFGFGFGGSSLNGSDLSSLGTLESHSSSDLLLVPMRVAFCVRRASGNVSRRLTHRTNRSGVNLLGMQRGRTTLGIERFDKGTTNPQNSMRVGQSERGTLGGGQRSELVV